MVPGTNGNHLSSTTGRVGGYLLGNHPPRYQPAHLPLVACLIHPQTQNGRTQVTADPTIGMGPQSDSRQVT